MRAKLRKASAENALDNQVARRFRHDDRITIPITHRNRTKDCLSLGEDYWRSLPFCRVGSAHLFPVILGLLPGLEDLETHPVTIHTLYVHV